MKNKKKPVKPQPPGNKPKAKIIVKQEVFWRKHVPAALIILVISIGLYFSTRNFDYALDDMVVISDNTFTNQGFAGIKKIFTEESFTGFYQKQQDLVAGSRYRPLSIMTFAIERQFFQSPKEDGYGNPVKDAGGKQLISGNPAISHFINILLYALSALLLYRVLFLLFPAKNGCKWYMSVPFVATLLFIVHPLHTEVVANIKGRDEIMSLIFSLAALYYTFRFVSSKKIKLLLASAVCYFLALLSKENALTFLVIIPLTVYFFTNAKRSVILRTSLIFLFVTFIYLIIRFKVVGFIVKDNVITDIMNNPFLGMRFGQKIATIIYTLGLYVKLLFIPHPLTHDYYPYTISVMTFSDWQIWVSLALYILLGLIAIKGFKNKNPLSYSVLFYIITLSIVSNLVLPIGAFMNERFIYMSSVGFCVAMAYLGLEKLPALYSKHSAKLRWTGIMILAVFTIYFLVRTVLRVPVWKNNFTLSEADIVTSANSTRANCYMGMGLYMESLQVRDTLIKMKLLDSADAYVKKSLEIYPAYGAAFQMLSVLSSEEFKYDDDATKLLNSFSVVLLNKKNNPEEIDRYLLWMNRRGKYNQQLLLFYHKIAYELFFKQEHIINKAEKYCRMGLTLDPNNEILQKDLLEIEAAKPHL